MQIDLHGPFPSFPLFSNARLSSLCKSGGVCAWEAQRAKMKISDVYVVEVRRVGGIIFTVLKRKRIQINLVLLLFYVLYLSGFNKITK